jgi:endonuclease YncB( thermonuclease family)
MVQNVGTGRRIRGLIVALGITLSTAAYGWAAAGPGSAGPALSISISGNHFVNGEGQTIRLLGVDAPSTEYACDQGWGYS